MPFVLVGLGELIFAIVVVLVCLAFVVFGRSLAQVVPDIPFIGDALRRAISDGTNSVESFAVNVYKQYFVRVGDWMAAHAWMLVQLEGKTISVLSHLGDQVSYLNNTSIPAAQTAAETAANAHANSLATSLQDNINAAGVAVAHDVTSLQNNINALTNYVNGTFETNIDNAINAARTGAETEALAELVTVSDTLQGYINNLGGEVNTLDTLTQVTIPAEIARAQAAAEATAQANLVTATQTLQGYINEADRAIQANSGAIAAANAVIDSNTRAIAELSVDVEANAGAIAVANANIATATQAIATAQGAIDQNTQSIDSVAGSINDLIGQDVLTQANIGTNPASIALPITATLIGVATAVAELTTEFDNCAVTSCAGPNNFSNLLQDALGLADFAVFTGFINSALKDPTGEAASIAGMGQGLYNAGDALLDSLLSL